MRRGIDRALLERGAQLDDQALGPASALHGVAHCALRSASASARERLRISGTRERRPRSIQSCRAARGVAAQRAVEGDALLARRGREGEAVREALQPLESSRIADQPERPDRLQAERAPPAERIPGLQQVGERLRGLDHRMLAGELDRGLGEPRVGMGERLAQQLARELLVEGEEVADGFEAHPQVRVLGAAPHRRNRAGVADPAQEQQHVAHHVPARVAEPRRGVGHHQRAERREQREQPVALAPVLGLGEQPDQVAHRARPQPLDQRPQRRLRVLGELGQDRADGRDRGRAGQPLGAAPEVGRARSAAGRAALDALDEVDRLAQARRFEQTEVPALEPGEQRRQPLGRDPAVLGDLEQRERVGAVERRRRQLARDLGGGGRERGPDLAGRQLEQDLERALRWPLVEEGVDVRGGEGAAQPGEPVAVERRPAGGRRFLRRGAGERVAQPAGALLRQRGEQRCEGALGFRDGTERGDQLPHQLDPGLGAEQGIEPRDPLRVLARRAARRSPRPRRAMRRRRSWGARARRRRGRRPRAGAAAGRSDCAPRRSRPPGDRHRSRRRRAPAAPAGPRASRLRTPTRRRRRRRARRRRSRDPAPGCARGPPRRARRRASRPSGPGAVPAPGRRGSARTPRRPPPARGSRRRRGGGAAARTGERRWASRCAPRRGSGRCARPRARSARSRRAARRARRWPGRARRRSRGGRADRWRARARRSRGRAGRSRGARRPQETPPGAILRGSAALSDLQPRARARVSSGERREAIEAPTNRWPERAATWLPALVALALALPFATRYGIFRDELYYVACARRLAWGYVDHPPLVALLTAGWTGCSATRSSPCVSCRRSPRRRRRRSPVRSRGVSVAAASRPCSPASRPRSRRSTSRSARCCR